MAVNLKIVSQVAAAGIPGPVGKSAYQIAVDNGFEGTESEWLKELHPFKGWFDSVSELENEHFAPSVGEYAYVKGATSSDPVKIYECSTEGSWSDSGRTVDTTTVQTFRSGEAVNDVDITDDSSDIEENSDKIPTAGAVANVLGNTEFSTGEKIKDVGIDSEPTAGSDNLVKSGGVYNYFPKKIIVVDEPTIESGFVKKDGSVQTDEDYGHVNGIALLPNQAIFVNHENRVYTPSSASALYETDSTGSFITNIIDGGGSKVIVYTNQRNTIMYVGFSAYNINGQPNYQQCKYTLKSIVESATLENLEELKTQVEIQDVNDIKSWILNESYTLTNATYSDGIINSPVNIVWPDDATGTLTITRNSIGLVTLIVATHGNDTYTYTITRDSDGNVTATSISKQ